MPEHASNSQQEAAGSQAHNQESPQQQSEATAAQQQTPGQQQEAPKHQAEKLREIPLPPPTFSTLVSLLETQARLSLGPFPPLKEGEHKPDLKLAQHFIDLLAILEEKTRGNLTSEEQRYLQNTLTELRFLYVEVASLLQKGASG